MSIPALPSGAGGSSPTNPWSPTGEVPPGPPMPMNSPWVQALMRLFPNEDPAVLSMYAFKFQQNMFQALNNELSRMSKKQHEAAERMKRVIEGQE